MKRLLLPFLLSGCELIVHFDPPPEQGAQCSDKLDNDEDDKIDCADDSCADYCRCGNGIVYPPAPSLAAPLEAMLAGVPRAVAAGDIDGDGTTDLVVALQGGQVVVVRVTGAGLSVGTPVSVPGTLVALALGDLDGNGSVDALVVDQAGGQVYPLRNSGGTFTVGQPLVVTPMASAVVLGDFDGNGELDAAVVGGGSQPQLVTLVNSGGTFRVRQSLPADAGASALAVADLDGDGFLDLVVGATGDVVPYRNADAGFFQAGTAVAIGGQATGLALADLDGDRRPDLVVATPGGALGVLRNDGQGTLGSGTSVAVPGATALAGVAAGDLNHDGNADVVVAAGTRLVIMDGDGAGALRAGAETTATADVASPVLLFADGDSRPDVAAVTSDQKVLVALGAGEECDSPDRTMCLADCTLPGKAVWARAAGGAQDDVATDVAVDAEDNVYVVGTFRGQLAIGGTPALPAQGGSDFFVASFKPDGTLRWRAAFGGKMDDTAEGVAALRFGSIVVVGQSGPASYGSVGQIGFDQQAYALVLSAADGSPQFLSVFTDSASTGAALAVTLDSTGGAVVGGRFTGRLNVGSAFVSGPGGFLADLSFGQAFATFTGDAADAVVRVRATGGGTAALLSFAGTVPELAVTSEGARDLAVVRYDALDEFVRADIVGGAGDALAADIADCPPSLVLAAGFSGALRVGQTTFAAQGASDAAIVRLTGGTTSAATTMAAGAEVANAVACDARGNAVVGGSLSIQGATAAVGSFAPDGTARWGLPGGFAPARFARDSLGDVYAAGSFTAALAWGADSLTPAGGSDGVLAKLRP